MRWVFSSVYDWARGQSGYRGRPANPKQTLDAFGPEGDCPSIPLQDTPPRPPPYLLYNLQDIDSLIFGPNMRLTRAALRAQAHEENHGIHEDSDASAHLESQASTPSHDDATRPVLKDITHENYPTPENMDTEQQAPLPGKRAKGAKPGKKTKKQDAPKVNPAREELQEQHEPPKHEQPEESECNASDASLKLVAETGSDSTLSTAPTSAAVREELPEETLEPGRTKEETELQESQFISEEAGSTRETVAVPEPEAELLPHSTPNHSKSSQPKTPKFDPSLHKLEPESPTSTGPVEDSFVDKIRARSPSKMQSSDSERSPDSFVGQIISRTPRVARIEDCVEEIDRLEDALEEISEKLPALDHLPLESPVKSVKTPPARITVQSARKPLPATSKPTSRAPAATAGLKNSTKTPSKPTVKRTLPATTKTTVAPKPTARVHSSSGPSAVVKPTKRVSTITKVDKKPALATKKPTDTTMSTKVSPAQPASPAKTHANITKKRVPSETLSTSKPGFMPAKSTKAPTVPSFQLPGEAISEKLRAQREERQRREEEAEKERKTFKARPAPAKSSRLSVAPRENKASQARQSAFANGVNKENVSPKAVRIAEKLRMGSPKPRGDAHPTISRSSTEAKATLCSRLRDSSLQLSSGQKQALSKEEVAHQKVKAKEIFSRTKLGQDRMDKERKEKEEAAKKARAEAAEKGRQASREWAEKQKRKLAEKVAQGEPSATVGVSS